MVLDENPSNYFADVEQIAFAPSHMVPGIEPSPDKMLQVGYGNVHIIQQFFALASFDECSSRQA